MVHIRESGTSLVSSLLHGSSLPWPTKARVVQRFQQLLTAPLPKGNSRSPTAASFVRPSRPADNTRDFLGALVGKYTAEIVEGGVVRFSGKVAEEVGFEKTRRKQANLASLKVAILDGERITSAYLQGPEDLKQAGNICQTCPEVRDLDLSRNLFRKVSPVVDICSELQTLRSLRLK